MNIEPRVIAASDTLLRAPDGRFWAPGGPLEAADAGILRQCRALLSLEDQAALISERSHLGDDQIPSIIETLSDLQQQGLLLDETALRSIPAIPESSPGISRCAVLSCNRPEALYRQLQTLTRPSLEPGRELLIANDGDPLSLPAPLGLQAEVIDRQHRARWVAGIEDADLRTVAEWALWPHSPGAKSSVGANINAVLLANLGRQLALLDDDICAPLGRAIQWEPSRWQVCGPDTMGELFPYQDIDAAIDSLLPDDRDVATVLETALGRSLPSLMQERYIELDLTITPPCAQSLLAGGRVLTTMMGFAGDSGMGHSLAYLALEGDGGRRLDQDFEHLLLSRALVRAAPHTRFSQSAFFMNACVGLDLRDWLPPFYPLERNSDGLFGQCLQRIFPTDFRLYLPQVVSHRPVEDRQLSRQRLLDSIGVPGLNELLSAVIERWQSPQDGGDPGRRMQQLGLHLESLGRQARPDFCDWLRGRQIQTLAARLAWFEQLLDIAPPIRHPIIQASLQRVRQIVAQFETTATPTAPGLQVADYADGLRRFGALLQAWEALCTEARQRPLHGDRHAI